MSHPKPLATAPRRRRPCERCGYDTGGLSSRRCPECGHAIGAAALPIPLALFAEVSGIAALMLGCVSLGSLGLVLGPLAIAAGLLTLPRVARGEASRASRRPALVGLATGTVAVVLSLTSLGSMLYCIAS